MRQRLKISGAFLNEATRIFMLIVAVDSHYCGGAGLCGRPPTLKIRSLLITQRDFRCRSSHCSDLQYRGSPLTTDNHYLSTN